MLRNIAIIDDSIAVNGNISVDDTGCLNRSILLVLLEYNDKWVEPPVKELLEKLCEGREDWNVSAFTHPNIYLKAITSGGCRPEIIIYDWEYPAGGDDPEEMLLEILKTTYAFVYVYTHIDQTGQVSKILSSDKFSNFKPSRLDILQKGEESSPEKLLDKAKQLYNDYFSFRFGGQLRRATYNALEDVLIEFGKNDINFVASILGDGESGETDLKIAITEKIAHCFLENDELFESLTNEGGLEEVHARNLLAALKGKVKDAINSAEVSVSSSDDGVQSNVQNIKAAKDLWSYRLYFAPSDGIVRKGDIIYSKKNNGYFLVISADCDLARFWHKNFGFINVVPLYNFEQDLKKIQSLFGLTRNNVDEIIKNIKPRSITDMIDQLVEGPFILPFIKLKDGFLNFVGFPKSMRSIEIAMPDSVGNSTPGERKKQHLIYTYWDGFDRIVTLSEPFLTPITQHCLNSISGYAAPDYPGIISNGIKEDIKAVLPTEE